MENQNINGIQDCSKAISEQTKGRNQDRNDHENSGSTEPERSGNEINNNNSEITAELSKSEKRSIKNKKDNGNIVKSGTQRVLRTLENVPKSLAKSSKVEMKLLTNIKTFLNNQKELIKIIMI